MNIEDTNTETAALFAATREAYEPRTIQAERGDGVSAPLLLVPDGMQVVDPLDKLDARLDAPRAAKGTSRHQTLASLVDHTRRHSDEGTVAWLATNAQGPSAGLAVVYDYNREKTKGARWGRHRAEFAFPISDEWKAWLSRSGKAMGQAELAAFLEDHIHEVRGPSSAGVRVMEIARALIESDEPTDEEARSIIATPTQLLRLSRRIAMHVETRAVEERDDQGNTFILYRSEATAENAAGDVKEKVTLPRLLIVEVPVIAEGTVYALPVRLATKVVGQRVQWTLTVCRADVAFNDAVSDAAKKFTEDTGVPVFRGAPEA